MGVLHTKEMLDFLLDLSSALKAPSLMHEGHGSHWARNQDLCMQFYQSMITKYEFKLESKFPRSISNEDMY